MSKDWEELEEPWGDLGEGHSRQRTQPVQRPWGWQVGKGAVGCAGLCPAGPTLPSSYRTAFNNNVSVAYECLSASGRKKKPGLDGRTYSELLKRICRDGEAPEEVVAPLLHKIQCRDHEAVPLDVFRAGMLTCFVLLEFVARASALYQLLEDPALAVADRRVGQAVLDTLEGALQASDGGAVPARYLEAGSRLGPDSLALAMDRALVAQRPSSPMTREEFLEKAAALFIAKVKPVA